MAAAAAVVDCAVASSRGVVRVLGLAKDQLGEALAGAFDQRDALTELRWFDVFGVQQKRPWAEAVGQKTQLVMQMQS